MEKIINKEELYDKGITLTIQKEVSEPEEVRRLDAYSYYVTTDHYKIIINRDVNGNIGKKLDHECNSYNKQIMKVMVREEYQDFKI